ncbi:MAG: PQQ-binding-like beta-propeller repeat protein [Deltaproteobacteria bacterium]
MKNLKILFYTLIIFTMLTLLCFSVKSAVYSDNLYSSTLGNVSLNYSTQPLTITNSVYSNISFGNPEDYSSVSGVVCFRGNNYRNSASYGTAQIKEEKLETIWNYKIGSLDNWTGVGWNGQPAIVKWDDSVKNIMNIFPAKKKKANLKEVIYGALDGKVHFLDLEKGDQTRLAIQLPGPIKGSVSIDPRGYPLLYVGQGIPTVHNKPVAIGYRIYNLINQKMLYFINGKDSFAERKWYAFDSTSLLDTKTDTLIEPGENGIVYVAKLNTSFIPEKKFIKINPKFKKYRYSSQKSLKKGIENSAAIYKNFAYFADNDGIFQCLDLNTLKPVWARDVTDDTDCTTVLDEEGDKVFLYTGCEVDHQGKNGKAYIRKINALTGALVWQAAFDCFYNSNVNGGVFGTPVLGKSNIDGMIIFSTAKCNGPSGGKLTAFNKISGKKIWELNFKNYSWSSPVDVYTSEGKAYLIYCDSAGMMYLIDPQKGKILDRKSLGANIEGSPAVYENIAVVGTRGQRIWGIRIK